ncbi:MAG: metallophosphoesterase [Eubacterium sp.]|nr:metallophosphoesterase [Eubacterium sp.]
MRFIHTGDVHLGANPESKTEWGKNRGDELWSTFERLIKKIKVEPVDLLIIAGDLFHRQPLLRELKEVDYLFSTIPDTTVVLCAGNHDAIKKGSFYRDFKWSSNVKFLGDRDIQKVELPDLNLCIYGLSYYENEITDPLYDHIIVDEPEKINVLVAHGGDEKHIPMNRKKMAMSGFDYVAMGHIHIPDIDEKNKMAYCGTLEPIDCGDIGERGYISGVLEKERLDLEFVPFAKRNYMELKFSIHPKMTSMELRHRLRDLIEEQGADNMYRIQIEGYRDPDFDVFLSGIEEIGNIVSIEDLSVPDFDFQELYEGNKDNILGMFIKKHLDAEPLEAMEQKVLYYGTKALLDAMEDKL